MEKSKVALVRCDSYEQEKVEAAVRQVIDLLGGFEQIFSAARGKDAALREAASRMAGGGEGEEAGGSGCGTVPAAADGCGRAELLEDGWQTGKRETLDAAIVSGETRLSMEAVAGNKCETVPEAETPAGKSGKCGAFLNQESRLVLKPNLLAKTPPEKACTTHPAVFQAVGKLLQDAGYRNLKYGDSPGNPMLRVEKVAEGCGIKAAADALGIPIGDFEHGIRVDFPQGRAADHFIVCGEAVAADGIINICKMKTHQLERITGAVKNTFGCVFGVNKASSHARFATAETFAKMIADLNRLVSPALHIMDGIVAMEGNGPQGGTPKAMNVILASTDPVALDGLFCHLVYLKPELVPTNVTGMAQGVGTYEDLQVITAEGVLTAEEAAARYGDRSFGVQRSKEYRGRLEAVRFLAPFLEKKPIVRPDACIGCGVCVQACPVEGKAIHLQGQAVRVVKSGAHIVASEGKRRAASSPASGGCPFGIGDGSLDAGGDSPNHKGCSLDAGTDSPNHKGCLPGNGGGLPGGQSGLPASENRRIARYDYSKCIKCYCCQEMCPQDAITVKKSLLARLADRNWRI